jgi:hypothetical protein
VATNSAHSSSRLVRTVVLGAAALVAAGALGERDAAAQTTFTVTTNSYDGGEWWGTLTFKNNGPGSTSSYKVEFDVPVGAHCTAEPGSVPAGATLSPLSGDGTHTVSNHCVFNWASTTALAAGQSKTFNYSTDTQSFTSANNVTVQDNTTGAICSTFSITKNVYDGKEWWGTISFKNNGPFNSYNYKVEFDVPSGVHCTNDYVPPGATLSPLTGTGSSAHTTSNHCVYSWSNASPVAPGGSKTFNYSTDSQNFKSANNLKASDAATCTGGTCLAPGVACTPFDFDHPCCSGACACAQGPENGCYCGI